MLRRLSTANHDDEDGGTTVATIEQCHEAMHGLAAELSSSKANSTLDRSLSCTIRDLDVVFGGRFRDGQLLDIAQVDTPAADIKLTTSSDDLLALVAGDLNLAKAWGTGKLKIQASIMDMMKLRELLA